ncbi:hypothetical protein FIU86_20000 [Roseovarius sp. THAF9]|uniref:flagellar biosynthesis protein n=1 Tax=Roseovarius sp. THAF9 TaxID=2587847 RepID=UPI0012686D4C|nr:flagellar biosynthesis protein [Roseovarius sp. THAF9]QFT95143.1 hypothetical protein FIU86_20000 [Roseovarius sp. THAF9]
MSVSHLLEDFGTLSSGDTIEMTDVLLEEERLEAFEKGYQAGWDDSVKAQEGQAGHVSAEFARAVEDIDFTQKEAFRTILEGVRPLIMQIVETVLPAVARETLSPRLSEIIMQQVAVHGRRTVLVCVAPGQSAALDVADLGEGQVSVSVEEDATLSPDQVQVRFEDGAEQEIDLHDTIARIATAIDAYFTTALAEEQRKSA